MPAACPAEADASYLCSYLVSQEYVRLHLAVVWGYSSTFRPDLFNLMRLFSLLIVIQYPRLAGTLLLTEGFNP